MSSDKAETTYLFIKQKNDTISLKWRSLVMRTPLSGNFAYTNNISTILKQAIQI